MPKLSELKTLASLPPGRVGKPIPIAPIKIPMPTPINDGLNPYLRCSLPAMAQPNPDSLRQFYRAGTAQTRITPA